MTTTLNDATRAVQDQYLATVRQSQQAVVDAVNAWASAMKEITPAVPVATPAELPKPTEVIDNAFDFAQKLLDAQRDFSQHVIAAASPVLDGPASKKATKSA
jgi:hypothetical protein